MRKISLFLCFSALGLLCIGQSVTILPSGLTPANPGYERMFFEEILAIPNPVMGDLVYDKSFGCLRTYNGSRWLCTYQSPTDLTPQMIGLKHGGNVYDNNRINDMEVDGSGGIVVVGTFANTIDFGGVTLSSAGFTDIFIAKYSYDGSLIWAKRAGGIYSDIGRAVAVDPSGNIYVAGRTEGNSSFGGMNISAGFEDSFLAKYDKNGNIEWVELIGGADTQEVYDLVIDDFGSPHLTGFFQNSMIIGAETIPSTGQEDLFLAKYDENGVLKWVERAGGAGRDYAWGMALDESGNVFITGQASGSPNFGAIPLNGLSAQGDAYVAKYSPTNEKWEFAKAGTAVGSSGKGRSIRIYQSNFYLTGDFISALSLDGVSINSSGAQDVFLASYDLNGNLIWLKGFGGTDSEYTAELTIDLAGQIYLVGDFYGTTNFGGKHKTSNGDKDFYLAKFTDAGEVIWLQATGGESVENGNTLAIDNSGNLFAAGSFRGNVNFGLTNFNSGSDSHFFIARTDK